MAMLGSIANTCTPDIRTNRDFNQLLAVWSSCRQIFRICTVRYAEGPVTHAQTWASYSALYRFLEDFPICLLNTKYGAHGPTPEQKQWVTEQLGDL